MRVGSLGYCTQQGLGYLHKTFFDNGIITDPMISLHPKRQNHFSWFPPCTPRVSSRRAADSKVDEVLNSVQVMLFFETPFDWSLINRCRERGVKTVLIPMYEWTPERWPSKPDALFCPSLLDLDYFKDEFPEGCCPFIPIPVETKYWKLRHAALRFLHNAGNIGHREHKGTRQLLEAVKFVENPNFRLTVRGQDTRALESIVNDTKVREDSRVTVQLEEIPYATLWDDHDVYIAPEKFNGLSLPLQEAFAAGLLVITTDRYPHNIWLPEGPLVPVEGSHKVRVSRGCKEIEESIVSPESIAKVIDHWYGKSILVHSLLGHKWAVNNSWYKLKHVYAEGLERLCQ